MSFGLIFGLITIVILGLGALFGFLRGRNRSVLSIGITVLCFILALCLKGIPGNIILGKTFNIPGVIENDTIENYITVTATDALADGGLMAKDAASQTVTNIMGSIVMPTVKSCLNLAGFIIIFWILELIGLIVFLCVKKLVKVEEPKQIVAGIPIGVVHSLILAFCLCGPFAGLISHAGKIISTAENVITALPSDMTGITENPFDAMGEYKNKLTDFDKSFMGKFYVKGFSPAENLIASSDGVKLSGTVEAVESLGKMAEGIAETVNAVGSFEKIAEIDITEPGSLSELKIMFEKIDEVNASSSPAAKEAINSMVTVAIESISFDGGELEAEIKEALKEVDFSDVKFKNEFEVLEKVQTIAYSGEPITKAEAEAMVKTFADSKLVPKILKKVKKAKADIDPEAKKQISDAIKDLTFETEKEKALVEDLKNILDL